MKKIGILALQGDFAAHAQAITRAGAHPLLIKKNSELASVDGLIIPGGESTTMLKLIQAEHLKESLLAFGKIKPIFGTCAGAILMAQAVCNPEQYSFNWLSITVERNSYGRQIDSRIVKLPPSPSFTNHSLEAVFIRAPRILSVASDVKVLATYENYPVLVEQGLHMAATFHPELTNHLEIHHFFLEKVACAHAEAF